MKTEEINREKARIQKTISEQKKEFIMKVKEEFA